MKRFAFLLASLYLVFGFMAQPGELSFGATAPVKTPFVDGVYRALIIGNNDYNDPEGLWMATRDGFPLGISERNSFFD